MPPREGFPGKPSNKLPSSALPTLSLDAELSSQLPRGLAKPAFSPELLEIAKQSISPAELAATMTLALAASSLDPVMLATKQQQIALTGSAAAALAAPASPGTPDLNHLTSAWASLAAQNQHSSSNFMGSGRTAADIFADYSNPSGAPNASAMQQPSMFWPSLAGSLSAPNDPAAISNLWSQYAGYGSFAATANDPSGFSFSPSGGSNQNPWQVAAASMQQGSYVPSRLGGPTAASAMMAPPTSYTHSVQPGAMAAPWPDMSAWGSMIPSAPATDAPGGMAVPAAVPPMQPVQQQ